MVVPSILLTPNRSYLTVAEFKAAPTGIDPASLVTGGTQGQEDAELANVIARASSMIDQLCGQVLAPTTDTERKRIRPGAWGQAWVMTDSFPIIRVTAFSYADDPSAGFTAVDLTAPGVLLQDERFFEVFCSLLRGREYRVQYTYENGWPNTALANSPVQGAGSIQVVSGLGLYPGQELTIYDGSATETVVVGAGYAAGTTVPTVSALLFGHSAGVAVSALPPAVKEAAILGTALLIKNRGAEAIILDEVNGTREAGSGPSVTTREDRELMGSLLANFSSVIRQPS